MIDSGTFLSSLVDSGIQRFIGVPCSYISGVYTRLEAEHQNEYLSATSEGEAIGIGAGVWLGGKQACVMGQNSGLGNMVNPLTSLIQSYSIPLLILISRRGWPIGTDEAQHKLMGEITSGMLSLMQLDVNDLPSTQTDYAYALEKITRSLSLRVSQALIINKGTIDNQNTAVPVNSKEPVNNGYSNIISVAGGRAPTRTEVMSCYLEQGLPNRIIASTGYNARTLYGLNDSADNFYMAGSMGCASSIALGYAHSTLLPITVFDGDGSLLMKLGNLSTVGRYVSSHYVYILMDNGAHESTGAQKTNSGGVRFAEIARACNFKYVYECDGIDAVHSVMAELKNTTGTVFIHCRTAINPNEVFPRPEIPLDNIALRFRHKTLDLAEVN
ncbi:phosphonopyruvate decarboxylase [Pseudomonas amygdali pv. morsprunorum]|nr:phosphonopyruvate decarboxylase [Pseudomonas amygdali]POY79847.1 phosphonopyruvate decarboxylase [Pseudomonas amygdali pv. morsprunorum]